MQAKLPLALLVTAAGALSPTALGAQGEWPSFRGPAARGVADGQGLPARWDVEQGHNVRWRTAIPGLGHSSPVVWGDRIYVTTAVAADLPDLALGDSGGIDLANDVGETSWRLYALDAQDGRVVWQHEAHRGTPKAKRHVKSSQANPTPATDGTVVVAIFGYGEAVAFEPDGAVRWRSDLGILDPGLYGDPTSSWGYASSPILWKDRVFVQVDRHAGSFLAAYRLADGAELWRVARDEKPVWSTPTVHRVGERDELIVIGGNQVRGYDPASGTELWRFADDAEVKSITPFVADGKIVLSGGYRGRPIFALQPGGRGDLGSSEAGENPHLAWRTDRGGPYTSTPVAYGGLLYSVRDEGILTVYDLADGAVVYRERTGTTHSASPVASDGKVYIAGEPGDVLVVAAGRVFELLARNDMGETVMATPAIAHGTLYLRSRGHLVAVAAGADAPKGGG